MNKTKTRVLSMVLTVFMLVSMLTVFAVADASPFATSYVCSVTVDGVPQIANTALLVDTTITEDNGATVTRTWDGADYTFVVGTNAFKSLADAYAYAKEAEIASPDIIVTGWTAGDNLVVEMESNVYGLNWNTAPMIEMTDDFNAIASQGADWTPNETYKANEMKVGDIKVNGDVENWAGIYGFTISKYIDLGVDRTDGAPAIDFYIKNCKMAGEQTNSNILKGYNNKSVNCTDSVTFKNFWLHTIDGTSSSASRFFGDNTRHLPHMNFDGLYVDFTKTAFLKTNDHLKSYFANSSMTFKNSNLRRSGTGNAPYWQLAQRADGVATTRELYYDNNVLYNTNQCGGFIYIVNDSWSKVEVTNNFVVATTANSETAVPLFMGNGDPSQGLFTEETFKVTGNILLGVDATADAKLKANVPMFIEDNFTVSTVMENVEDYVSAPGEVLAAVKGNPVGCSGSYLLGYDMVYSSKIKVTDVDFGPGSEVEIGADSISIKCLGEASVITPVFTSNPDTAAKAEVFFQLSSTSDFDDTLETVDIAKIAENKTATFYLRAYYDGADFDTVYQIKVIAATPVDFNGPFMENGFEFAGKKFVFEDTAVFVKDTEVEADGFTYGYGFLGDDYYKFKVDNSLVFDSMSMLKTQMAGVKTPNVLLPSGEYGEYTFEYAANYYGTNAGINPVDKADAESVIGDDWKLDSDWAAYADTAFDDIRIADGLEGNLYLEGLTIRGQFNDTLRTMGKDGKAYGGLDIVLNNTVVEHIRASEYTDARDEGLIKNNIGESTVDMVFNLINKRSTNANNTQVEYIDNQFMDIEYSGFSDTYDDSFTVTNLYVKNMRNAARLFNDFVPANVTIDNLYFDFAANGEKTDNTLGHFKTGAAVKSGSFTVINSNFRNGNTASALVPLGFQGPRGNNDLKVLPEGYVYEVTIENNIFYNSVPSAAAGKTLITVVTTLLSSLEIKDNIAFQTGANECKKAFIQNNTASVLKPFYSDPNLAIIGNIDVDNNTLIGFDDKDAALDVGLTDNNPVNKNAFVSEEGDAHTTGGLIGQYVSSMGKEAFYLDFAKTITNEDILVTAVTTEGNNIRYIDLSGFTISARIYGGTLAELDVITAAGKNTGRWASNKKGTNALDPAEVTPDEIGIGSSEDYYYVVTYTYGETDYEFIYTVEVTAGVDCVQHDWSLAGEFNNDATCQTNGTHVVSCKNTGCIETQTVEKPNSKVPCAFENYVYNNDATCVKAGTETGACKWCGTPDTRTNAELYPIAKTAHKWGEFVYNNDATCCKDGTETRVCEYGCGAYQTQVCEEHLKATVDHTWGEYTYDGTATCQKNGTKSAICTVDGCRAVNTIDDPNFPASDKYHVLGEFTYNKDATTTADGTKTATCEVCGESVTVTAEGTKLTVTIEDSSKSFKDVKSAWYKNAVDYVTSYGFVSGVSKTEFGVGKEVTRGMFVTILARMAGVDTSDAANKAATTKFSDVAAGKYYAAAIKWANENGIVSGTSDTTFSPNKSITRQDLAVMVVNFANFMNINLVAKEAEITFTDASSIAKYAKAAVKTCQMADIINGHTTGAFGPQDTATREQASQILFTLHSGFMK